MKMRVVVRCAVAALIVGAPLFAQAAELDPVQHCMDVFATQNFADRTVSFKVERQSASRLPLILNSGTRQVQLVASGRSSGRVLAAASCSVRSGITTVGEIAPSTRIAAR